MMKLQPLKRLVSKLRGGRATAIQTWRPEDERKVEIVQEILNHLIAIRKQDGTTDMLMTLAGVTQRLEQGQPFRAAVMLKDYAERQERGRLW